MKYMLKFPLACLFALMLVSEAWAVGGGAYSSTTSGPTVYSKNYKATSIFNPVGNFPPGSKISKVQYSYGTSYRPSGFEAYLCWDSTLNECINITNFQTGSTIAFNNRTPNHSFIMMHRVVGTGNLYPPVYGNSDQIIVTFTY